MKVYVWGDREIKEGNETTEKRVKTIRHWTRPRGAARAGKGVAMDQTREAHQGTVRK